MSRFFFLIFFLKCLFAYDFHDANKLFQENKYNEAIDAYEKLVQKTEDSALFYNLCLAYYKESLNSNNPPFFAKAVYNISLAYLLSPGDKQIRILLEEIEKKQGHSLNLEETYPPYKILFIQYGFFLESVVFLVFLLFILILIKKNFQIKIIFLLIICLFSFLLLIENERRSLAEGFSDILISLESKDNEPGYKIGDSFFINNEDPKRLAFTVHEQIFWIPKEAALQINMNHIKMTWSLH